MNTIYMVNEDMEWEYNKPIFVSNTLEGAIDFLANFAIEKGIDRFCEYVSYTITAVPVDSDINESKVLLTSCNSMSPVDSDINESKVLLTSCNSMSWERGKLDKYETLSHEDIFNAIEGIMEYDMTAYWWPNLPDVLYYMDQHEIDLNTAIRWDRQASGPLPID